MISKQIMSVCAAVFYFYLYAVVAQGNVPGSSPPRTRFTCTGRAAGYYADMDTGCQVYHMCDGLGRQFSYTCPNTTLFQQRMLICDHWYMVNCSMSERDYDANLLIGQRDKPFVSDAEMRQRTPRPDILSVPPNSNYYDGLREAETKYPIHPGNSIVGVADSITKDKNGLDSGKQQNYRPPTGWSTKRPRPSNKPTFSPNVDNLAVAASQRPTPTVQTPEIIPTEANTASAANVTPPSRELVPPFTPPTTESNSEEVHIDARMKPQEDPVFTFIKRFDPNSPDTPKTRDTAMTRTEIIDLNKLLPGGQVSSEEDRTPRKSKNFTNKNNQVQENSGKSNAEKSNGSTAKATTLASAGVSVPDTVLVPPKSEFSNVPTTTEGPPIYYEWKWAVPAFELAPPKLGNETNSTSPRPQLPHGESPFRDVTRRPTPSADDAPTPAPQNVEYNISSYFVPDYVFPLDKPHPGYEGDDAQTSFQVKVTREGRSYGENPACPQCHPAYLRPGACEPCVVKR